MHRFPRIALAGLAAALIGTPVYAQAQSQYTGFYRASDVAFFEQVPLGELDVTPINLFIDKRCPDPRLCTFTDRMIISVIVDDGRYRREVVLELGRPVAIEGGLLLLANPGVAPSWNGATPLDRYNLELRYIPIQKFEPEEERGI